MSPDNYKTCCQTILSGTLQYIETQNMPARHIDRSNVKNGNAVYKSAVASASPITLVYTPPGSGKTNLLYDRAEHLRSIGIRNDQIMILSMNIAKTKQIAADQKCVALTFSEFTHKIFAANYPSIELSDIDSVANTMRISNPNTQTQDFIRQITMSNPKDRVVSTSIWINQHQDDAIKILHKIKKADYMLESIICQNMMYQMPHNPYSVTDILVNGVHNMPLPILCALLEYANRFHCNLFMTGYPEETIYDFNMAYNKSMDIIASLPYQTINLIRLNQTILSKSILDLLNTARTTALPDIYCTNQDVEAYDSTEDIMKTALAENRLSQYILTKLQHKEKLLILARSKADVAAMRAAIEDHYKAFMPNVKICDLTEVQSVRTSYGTILAKYEKDLLTNYPDTITVGELGENLYHALTFVASAPKVSNHQKMIYETDRENLFSFITKHKDTLGDLDTKWNTTEIIRTIINIEEHVIQTHMAKMENMNFGEMLKSDIIFSTVHSAIDIRCDNVVLLLRCSDRTEDRELYHAALSRANQSEYIIFANIGKYRSEYQKYIDTYQKNITEL